MNSIILYLNLVSYWCTNWDVTSVDSGCESKHRLIVHYWDHWDIAVLGLLLVVPCSSI